MATSFYFFLSMLVWTGCSGDIQANGYVNWKKADISAWHVYFPSRALAEERLTNNMAEAASFSVAAGMEDSLGKVVEYQAQELRIAQDMMKGTSAQGCVEGIAFFMDTAIKDAISNYEECAADAVPTLRRLYSSWNKTYSRYQAAYQMTLAGIDNCARIYPNKDSSARLTACVDSWNNNYFAVANITKFDIYQSPSMSVFTNTVVACAEIAVQGVVDRGWKFLKMLVQCAKLSENIDSQTYEPTVAMGFLKYLPQNNLRSQMWTVQGQNYKMVKELEEEMIRYYRMQKNALERFVIECRSQGDYSAMLRGYLAEYFDTVAATRSHNPNNAECTSSAYTKLNEIITTGSSIFLQVDQMIVNHTKFLIAEVNNDFRDMNTALPSVGNPAILSCFMQGYIYAEDTIIKCSTLAYSDFKLNASDAHANIVKDVNILMGYESFFSNPALPDSGSILARVGWWADMALFELERCLYSRTGAKYAVTTPRPLETTVSVETITSVSRS